VALTCANTDEALKAMSDAEKKRLVAAGLPRGSDPLVAELFDKCRDYLALADKAGDPSGFVDALVGSNLTGKYDRLTRSIHENCQNVLSNKSLTKEGLARIEVETAASVTSLPAYVQPLVRRAVLLPMQQRLRKM
jgi:hypothetical protein